VTVPNDITVDPSEVDPRYRFVVALQAKLPAGVAVNAASHLCLGLVARATAERPALVPKMSFLGFTDADGDSHAPISGLSVVVLEGRPAWVRRLREAARAADLLYTDFTAEMTGGSYADQLDRIKNISTENLDYYGVAVFGERAEVDVLTRKFSLLR
jgi:hypothetical protein